MQDFESIASLMAEVDAGNLDYAILTPAAYVEIAQRLEPRVLATVTQEAEGGVYPWLASAVFVRDEVGAPRDMADVRGRSVVALDPLAVAGWLAAAREWRDLGIDLDEDIEGPEFRLSFDEIVQRVCNGQSDIGILSARVFHNLRASCPQPLRVLANPLYAADPGYPVAHSSRLYPELAVVALARWNDEALVIAMTKALLSVEAGSPVSRAVNVAGFTAPLNYEPVAALMQELRIGPFADFGRFTFTEVLQQHAGKVLTVMLLFLAALGGAFTRSQYLNRCLQQSERFRRQVFEQSTLPMVVIERDSLRYIDLNAAAVRLYGYGSAQELVGKSPFDISVERQPHGILTPELIREVTNAHAKPGGGSFEWLHKRPDGSQWEAEVHLLPFDFGQQQLLQGTLVDVTERNRIRAERARHAQQLQHSQRLESLGRLSAAIAHDFNNLLTVINGYSELLLLSLDKQSADYRTVLEIAQAGLRARELTNQLLTFGRRHVGNAQPLDVNQLILQSANMYRGLLGERVQLQTELAPQACMVLADAGQLNQVLMNMLANARDAMPDGGSCSISTRQLSLDAEQASTLGLPAGQVVLLRVTDTGTGMSPQTLEHVFEPFFSTKGDKGNGIGLATAYGIVRQCGGTITVESQSGHGTSFSIYLPPTQQQEYMPEVGLTAQGELEATAAFSVLVVDDHPDVRYYACTVLRSAGYQVLDADSGERALAILDQEGGVDLLFTDIVMPGMSGRELGLRCARHWPSVRVLYTSAYADDGLALHDLQQEPAFFIAKPYAPQQLLARVKTILPTLREAPPLP